MMLREARSRVNPPIGLTQSRRDAKTRKGKAVKVFFARVAGALRHAEAPGCVAVRLGGFLRCAPATRAIDNCFVIPLRVSASDF